MRIVQHLEREEIISGPHRGHTAIKKHAEELGIPIVSDQEWISDTLGRGQNPYRDNIHLNELGQKLLEAQLFELATAALSM
jgi:hypothetical protein